MTEARFHTSEINVNVAGALEKHRLLMWNSAGQNYVVATAATNIGAKIAGHLTHHTTEAGPATIRLLNAPGTAIGIASGAITEGDTVTAAAAGAVESDGAGTVLGVALETVATGESVMYRPFKLADSA